MKNYNKKDYIYLSIFLIFIIGYVLILYLNGNIFGSKVDWINQHTAIPDYFRQLFYNSGKLIPSFAFNLGMGQNIFNFSYYGLFSPIILISYLLPFIPMVYYIQIASLVCYGTSTVMFYNWIKKKYDSNTAFITALIFMLNSTFSYHFHRHIMFVIYMPFMIGALKSIDLYLEENKPIPLILHTTLLILTSYYFSVHGIITIGIYTIFKLLDKKKFKTSSLISVIGYVTIAILISGVLLIPTIYALLNGRIPTLTSNTNLLELISPRNNLNYTFYNNYYSWGITFIYIISIINGFLSKKKNWQFLSLIFALITVFPLFSYLLNAFMYIDGKCFLPMLPVSLLLISEFIDKNLKQKINYSLLIKTSIIVGLFFILISIGNSSIYLLIADSILMTITLILSSKKKNKYIFYIPTIIISLISFVLSTTNETYYTKSDLNKIDNNAYYELSNIKDESNLYRTAFNDYPLITTNKIYNINNLKSTMYSSLSNTNYFNFIRNIFQNEIINRDNTTITESNNILFNIYSGTKYLISEKDAPIGYHEINKIGNVTLYENNDIMPIGYASNKIMSKREFDTLTYPYTLDALLNYIIVDTSLDNVYKSNIQTYKSNYQITNKENLEYTKENNHYLIKANKNATLKIKLDKTINNEILIIKFKMNQAKVGYACSSNITINGMTNALSCSNWKYHNNNNTFEYVLSSNNKFNTLDITFTEGSFDISDIELYTLNYGRIKGLNRTIDQLIIDQTNFDSDKIIGTINAKNDGYVKTTIPYEKYAFKVYVDGELTNNKIIDNTFLGFEITKGTHNIEIKYSSPYLTNGLITSIIGIILLILVIIYQKNKNEIDKKIKVIIKYLNKQFKKLLKFIKSNKYYILMFISLYILDLSLRIYYNQTINYYHWYYLVPNLFSINWLILILCLTKNLPNKIGKTIYLIFYIFELIMFLVHAVYFSYFNTFFDYSVLSVAGEGADYFDSVIPNIKYWVIIAIIISIILTIKGLKNIKHVKKVKVMNIFIIITAFIAIEITLPVFLGKKNKEVEWDDWRNARTIYTSFNDNNKSMMVSGMFEYNTRNFLINYLVDKSALTKEEQDVLEDNFKDMKLASSNKYTGIFKGKNLILVQLESIDEFLLNKNIMPELYRISRNSINFTNHYSFTSGGGSTFNSEFMVNTGYSSAYNYNQSAYVFSKNAYPYSLPNLFKKEGYTVNAFHMNSAEYYSRGVNYKSFGYDSYNGLKDLNVYDNYEYWKDTELINNETFNAKLFNTEKPFVDYIITYSAHMPYKTTKGTCPLLTDAQGLTEEECLRIQAKETDDFIKLLIQNLKDKELIDNTVVVLFSDHYIYTLENKSLLDKYKETSNNLINHTPFMIYDNGHTKATIKVVNSQLDILPTILNLFGIEYYPNNYIGRDILDNKFDPLVFFSDGSWYNGSTYVTNGEDITGKNISTQKLEKYNLIVKRKMLLNDAIIKSDYFDKQK